jgi:hypothetical protein
MELMEVQPLKDVCEGGNLSLCHVDCTPWLISEQAGLRPQLLPWSQRPLNPSTQSVMVYRALLRENLLISNFLFLFLVYKK